MHVLGTAAAVIIESYIKSQDRIIIKLLLGVFAYHQVVLNYFVEFSLKQIIQ